ncbi:hypothetical protein [Streptomyces swartbergensis]|uniref:Uncharacterized protein n=1 Tax=Streptomyces swartbergensis TaxID=487165 RepID=A0A243S7W7_9ACTN|nr:hypothetical protein [Streptomyces swartbergensis]OUD03011.1 hypothetical protein CA983_11815 [Streptomyces swartbergensis]
MPSSIPPLPGLTRYTWWGAVPEGLLTKTQLDRQGLKPGSDPVGQVLYHGNCYAPLYEVSAAVPKRGCSPAQRAALDRARQLQRECRRCGVREDDPLGRGRYCDGCRYAMTMWEQHDQAQVLARELVADPAAVLLVVDVARDALPTGQAVAVVTVHDGQVLYAAPAGEYGTPERDAVLNRLDALLADRRVVEEPDHMGPLGRYPDALLRLPGEPVPPGRDPRHPWAAPHSKANPSVARIWSGWFGWTDYPYSMIPSVPRDGTAVPWTRSLDVAADGRSMVGVLHRIADGTEPVWEKAAWTVDGHGVPENAPRLLAGAA